MDVKIVYNSTLIHCRYCDGRGNSYYSPFKCGCNDGELKTRTVYYMDNDEVLLSIKECGSESFGWRPLQLSLRQVAKRAKN